MLIAWMMLMMGKVAGDGLDSEAVLVTDLEVGGTSGLGDIRQGFEESWQDFTRAEVDLKEAKRKVDDINDDIKKAQDTHTQVSNLFVQLLNDNSAYF